MTETLLVVVIWVVTVGVCTTDRALNFIRRCAARLRRRPLDTFAETTQVRNSCSRPRERTGVSR